MIESGIKRCSRFSVLAAVNPSSKDGNLLKLITDFESICERKATADACCWDSKWCWSEHGKLRSVCLATGVSRIGL